jgi:hypothetical protein
VILTDADELRATLAVVMRERAEVLSRAQMLIAQTTNDLEDARLERDEARAALKDVAERQREACADFVRLWRLDAKLGAIAWHSEDAVRATPLVTEVES